MKKTTLGTFLIWMTCFSSPMAEATGLFVRAPERTKPIQMDNPATLERPENLIYLDISTNTTFRLSGQQRLVVMLSTELSPGSEIPILSAGLRPHPRMSYPAFCVGGINCQSPWTDRKFYSAALEVPKTFRIGFSFPQLCSTPYSTGTLCGSQNGTAYQQFNGIRLHQNIVVHVAVVPDSSPAHAKILLPSDPAQPNSQRESRIIQLFMAERGIIRVLN